MKRILIVAVLVLSFVGITQIFAADWSSIIRVNLYPATIYVDGKEIKVSNQKGSFYNGTSYVPATIEYQGTIYVPLRMIGNHLNKQVGWDESTLTAWMGVPPSTMTSAVTVIPAPTKPDMTPNLPAVTVQPQAEQSLFGVTLGMTEQELLKQLGSPARKESGALGNEWWIYNRDLSRYVQIGVLDGKVVDIYSNAPLAKIGSVSIGTTLQSLTRKHEIKNTVSFTYQGAQVQITNQTKERPLTLTEETPIIFYLDKHNSEKVTAIRIVDKLTLLRGGFYETKWTYQGNPPTFDPPPLTIKERDQVNTAYERQTLDLVNVIRYRYKLPQLIWNSQAAQVARNHSLDMESNGFFNHVSTTTGLDPFERLKQAGVSYKLAGENIAAGYPDAIEAHESWMNSPGHRKNILEKGFTQLGVGVYTDYYTEAFVTLKN